MKFHTLNKILEYSNVIDYPVGSKPIILEGFGRRVEFARLLRDLNFKVGAEIGTDTGRYAKDLCEQYPDLKLYCIDPYLPYTEADEVKTQADQDAIYEEAKMRLEGRNCEIIRKTSMEAVKDFEDNSLDFVFIDGNHEFSYVYEDICEWTKIVKPGGIIAGHDYKVDPARKYGVIEAVNKYTDENNIKPWFILYKGARLVDCWMFVKEENE